MNKDLKRNTELIDLYKKGVSATKLARLYNISRIRIYQILDENNIKRNKRKKKLDNK